MEVDYEESEIASDEKETNSNPRIKITFSKDRANMGEAGIMLETPPAVEVELMQEKKPQGSPSAVADVLRSSAEVMKESFLSLKRIDDDEYDDYPSDEEPNPAEDDYRFSPLPFDPEANPNSLMALPENILTLPISPCGGSADGSEEGE
jgi:hypothetical protein